MPEAFKFQLVAGGHVDAKLQVFKKGDIVLSTVDLHKRHGSKFQYYQGPVKAKFIFNTADEVELEDVTVATQVQVKNPGNSIQTTATPAPDGGDGGAKSDDVANPNDVTAKFPAAVENGMVVMQKDDGFFVYDAADLTDPLNEEILAGKKVTGWLKNYLAE